MLVRKSFGGGAGDFKADGSIAMTGPLSTNVGTFTSAVANGVAAKGFAYNTPAYTTTAKLASWANNSVEKAYIQQDGALVLQSFLSMTIGARGANGWDSDGRSLFVNGGALRYSYNYSSMLETPALAPLAIGLGPTATFRWGSSNPSGSYDVGLYRKASGILELNNGTAGTYAGSAFTTGSQTIAQLPAAATAGAGARAFVTDANSTTFLSVVASGGANKVPVVSDGTNWLIG